MENNFLSAHQPAFFPWLGYLHRIAISKKFVILDNVQFEKNSFINRNIIDNQSLKSFQWLTVPILIKGHFSSKIRDIRINNSSNWKKKHLKTLLHEYKNYPFFLSHFEEIEMIYNKNHIFLVDLNMELLFYVLKTFSINTEIHLQSDLKLGEKGNELINSICKHFNFENFIFGIQGKNYVNNSFYNEQKIKTFEHKYSCNYSEKKYLNKANLSCLEFIFKFDKRELRNFLFKENLSSIDII